MSIARLCLLLLLGWVGVAALAQDGDEIRYVADIELQTEADLDALLLRAEQLFVAGELRQDQGAGLTIVLHGPVLRSLLRRNYLGSKAMVDRAASLSALGVVAFNACQSWMGANDVDAAGLQPFVSPVPYGSGEVQRLVREQGYIYF